MEVKGIGVLNFIITLINIFLIYKISRKLDLDEVKSLIVVTISMTFMSFISLENPCTESIALPFVLFALYNFIKFIIKQEEFNKLQSLYTGFCLGAVLLLRPNIASLWIIYDLFIFFKLLKEKKIKKLFTIVFFSVLGLLIILLPFLIYLICNNALSSFFEIYIMFNIKYMKIKNSSIFSTIEFFINNFCGFLVLTIFISLISMIFLKCSKEKRILSILNFLYLLISIFLLLQPHRVYNHYLIPLLSCIIIPMSMLLKNLKDKIEYIIIPMCVIIIIINILSNINKWKNETIRKEFEVFSLVIQKYTNEEDNVLQMGNLSNIYITSNRKYKGKYFFSWPIAIYDEKYLKEYLEEINKNKPKLIIDFQTMLFNDADLEKKFNNLILEFLDNYYIKLNDYMYLIKDNVNNENLGG